MVPACVGGLFGEAFCVVWGGGVAGAGLLDGAGEDDPEPAVILKIAWPTLITVPGFTRISVTTPSAPRSRLHCGW